MRRERVTSRRVLCHIHHRGLRATAHRRFERRHDEGKRGGVIRPDAMEAEEAMLGEALPIEGEAIHIVNIPPVLSSNAPRSEVGTMH